MKEVTIEKLGNGNVRIRVTMPKSKAPVEVEIPAADVEALASMLQLAARSAFFKFTQKVG
jgi:hypothetical protein